MRLSSFWIQAIVRDARHEFQVLIAVGHSILQNRQKAVSFQTLSGKGSLMNFRYLPLVTLIFVLLPGATPPAHNSEPTAFNPNPGTSCRTIMEQGLSRGDGVYWVDPDGGDSRNSIQAYCDMTENGGGWTLLIKTTGDETFRYSSPLWANKRLLRSNELSTVMQNAKYMSYLKVPIHEMRACFPTQQGHCIKARLPGSAQTARNWLSGFPVKLGKGHDGQRLDSWSTQPNCRYFGLNTPHCNQRVRFGFTANQEDNCRSNDTAIGIGLGSHCGQRTPGRGAGQMCLSSECSNGQVNEGFVALLWGR